MSELRVTLPDDLVEEIVETVVERVLTELRRERERRFLPVREAAIELGMSEAAVRKHVARRQLPASRIGSRIVIDMSAIEEA